MSKFDSPNRQDDDLNMAPEKPAVISEETKVVKRRAKQQNFFEQDLKETAYDVKDSIVIPAVKHLIEDALLGAIHGTLWGRQYSTPSSGKTDYAGAFRRGNGIDRPFNSSKSDPRPQVGYLFEECIFESKYAAYDVLNAMKADMEEFGLVRVSDMYDYAHMPHSYTDVKYGWTNLDGARVSRRGSDWGIDLPKPKPIK